MSADLEKGIQLSSLFSDGMVLQRETEVPVWGWGPAGSEIEVRFKGQISTACCDDEGKWMVRLSPHPASSDPADMTIQMGSDSVTIRNVVVGEVWLASGQSNIEISFEVLLEIPRNSRVQSVMEYVTEEMCSARDPLLRQIRVPEATSLPRRKQNLLCELFISDFL